MALSIAFNDCFSVLSVQPIGDLLNLISRVAPDWVDISVCCPDNNFLIASGGCFPKSILLAVKGSILPADLSFI